MRHSSIIALGNVFALLSLILMSLSPTLGIPHKVGCIWGGILLNGIAYSLIYSPIVPYLIDYYERHPITKSMKGEEYHAQLIAKMIPFLYLILGVSEMVSPFIGGLIYEEVGYSSSF